MGRRRVEQRGEPKKEAEPITMTEETQYTPKTVKDVDAHEFVRQYAKHLKGKLTPCENVDLIKTGCYKELSPYDPDWYYVAPRASPGRSTSSRESVSESSERFTDPRT